MTGRSRLWLFAVRVPAALIVTLTLALAALGVALAARSRSRGGLPTPSASFVIDSVLWVCSARRRCCA